MLHCIGLSAFARLPTFEPMVEHARHAHALVCVQHVVVRFVFVVAFFQCVQVPVFFDVPKDGIHHHADFIIRDVRNHGGVRDGVVIAVQHVIYVILNIGLQNKRAPQRSLYV